MTRPSAPTSSATLEPDRWFASEVQPHDGQLKAYLRSAFPSLREVDDVVQESYVRIWKARAAAPILCAKAFLFRVARNVALDLLRRERTSTVDAVGSLAALPVVDDGGGVTEAIAHAERIAALADALTALPPRCREVVIQCKLEGRSYQEVALALGLSKKTVAEHVYRGVQRLGCELTKRGVPHFRP